MDVVNTFSIPSAVEAERDQQAIDETSCCSRIITFAIDFFKMIVYVLSCTMIDLWGRTTTDETQKAQAKTTKKPDQAPSAEVTVEKLKATLADWSLLCLRLVKIQEFKHDIAYSQQVVDSALEAKRALKESLESETDTVVSFPPQKRLFQPPVLPCIDFSAINGREALLRTIEEYKSDVAKCNDPEIGTEPVQDVKKALASVTTRLDAITREKNEWWQKASSAISEVEQLRTQPREPEPTKVGIWEAYYEAIISFQGLTSTQLGGLSEDITRLVEATREQEQKGKELVELFETNSDITKASRNLVTYSHAGIEAGQNRVTTCKGQITSTRKPDGPELTEGGKLPALLVSLRANEQKITDLERKISTDLSTLTDLEAKVKDAHSKIKAFEAQRGEVIGKKKAAEMLAALVSFYNVKLQQEREVEGGKVAQALYSAIDPVKQWLVARIADLNEEITTLEGWLNATYEIDFSVMLSSLKDYSGLQIRNVAAELKEPKEKFDRGVQKSSSPYVVESEGLNSAQLLEKCAEVNKLINGGKEVTYTDKSKVKEGELALKLAHLNTMAQYKRVYTPTHYYEECLQKEQEARQALATWKEKFEALKAKASSATAPVRTASPTESDNSDPALVEKRERVSALQELESIVWKLKRHNITKDAARDLKLVSDGRLTTISNLLTMVQSEAKSLQIFWKNVTRGSSEAFLTTTIEGWLQSSLDGVAPSLLGAKLAKYAAAKEELAKLVQPPAPVASSLDDKGLEEEIARVAAFFQAEKKEAWNSLTNEKLKGKIKTFGSPIQKLVDKAERENGPAVISRLDEEAGAKLTELNASLAALKRSEALFNEVRAGTKTKEEAIAELASSQ